MLKLLFIIVSIMLILTIVTAKYFVFNCKNPKILSRCGILMGILFAVYSLFALTLMLMQPGIIYGLVLLLLALSPYIIGKLTKYENLNASTILQILFIAAGILYVAVY